MMSVIRPGPKTEEYCEQYYHAHGEQLVGMGIMHLHILLQDGPEQAF